jgi:hypothetical protein
MIKFRNLDCDPFDTPQKCGGVSGFALNLICRGGGGGGSEATTSTQTEYNQQVSEQGGAAGSQTIGTGAGSSNVITIQNTDPQVILAALQAAGGVSANAFYNANITASNAVNVSNSDLLASLGFGAETTGAAINAGQNDVAASLGFGAEVTGAAINATANAAANANALSAAAINANTAATGAAINAGQNDVAASLGFGAEVVNANSNLAGATLTVANKALNTTATLNAQDISAEENAINAAYNFASGAVYQIEGDNAQQAGFTAQTIQNLGADLAETAGVTPAVATPPPVQTLTATPNYSNWIIVAASLLSVYVFLTTKGNAT